MDLDSLRKEAYERSVQGDHTGHGRILKAITNVVAHDTGEAKKAYQSRIHEGMGLGNLEDPVAPQRIISQFEQDRAPKVEAPEQAPQPTLFDEPKDTPKP